MLKFEEIKELSLAELKKKEADLRRELMLARFSQANQQLKNPLKLRHLKRDIARILTAMNDKKGDQ